jgi:aspartate/methionine/tyrosine aminotransferase
MNAFVGRGDHAVVMWPAYQSLLEAARSAGAEVTPLRLRFDRQWRLDVEELASSLRPNTRLVVVNVPHNPTGMLPSRAEFDALVALCEKRGIVLFSDEVYRFGEFDAADRLPGACEAMPFGASLGGLAKPFGLAGVRIGWIALRDAPLLRRVAAFKDYLTICNSAPSEILALIALRAKDRVLARNRAIVEMNLALLDAFFDRRGSIVDWVRPRAGLVAFPRLKSPELIDDLARRLVEETGVLLLPGSIFDHEGNHFRVGFGRKNLPEALERFERFLAG